MNRREREREEKKRREEKRSDGSPEMYHIDTFPTAQTAYLASLQQTPSSAYLLFSHNFETSAHTTPHHITPLHQPPTTPQNNETTSSRQAATAAAFLASGI
ncbi:uncharacterized protein EAF02_005464 [Botrytis sinoallii]|uniref:uncharacterized protein n=1 Tax=Botrytis sinoallii TaxID=1463999 RepID=UPI00190153A3|nr:uncharacterized protein EAF02_005464 [Botrytis sinoallii]KAF7883544.1 hypothetical protein EAF02_005464 [Botrytis sinoallii]